MKVNNQRSESCDRRAVLTAGLLAVTASATAAVQGNEDAGVTAPEDLMKEHGVLNRCLLIYEEAIRRVQSKEDISPNVFHHTANLVRRFVEEYHEKNEEKYIFPVFQKAGKMTDLVQTLLTQHKAGRVVTAHILQYSTPDAFRDAKNREKVVAACQGFIRMYRPHESREDTVLFPALRSLLTLKQVEELGERMEEDEHKVLGDEGFEKAVGEVASIEKALGIYDLHQFTPKA